MIAIKIFAARLIILTVITSATILTTAYAGSPEDTLTSYIEAMKNHNTSPDLEIYTEQTKIMLKGWKVSTSQMDNIVNTNTKCHIEETLYNDSYNLAVIRYSIDQKQCSPWFFQYIKGDWLLDLTIMQKVIRFGVGNSWHFVPGINHEYDFGFADWKINSNGYPVYYSD